MRIAQPFNVVISGRRRQHLFRREEGHGPGTFATNLVQQRKVVLSGDLKLLRQQAAHLPLRQQAGEEGAGFVIIKWRRLQGQRGRQGKGVRL